MATYNNQEEENKEQETNESVEQNQEVGKVIERSSKIDQANAKLQHNTNEFIKSLSPKKKRDKRKKKNKKLVFPKIKSSSDLPERSGQVETEPPVRCFQIQRIMVGGVWITPQYPWVSAEIQTGIIDLAAFASNNPGYIYPLQGPFIPAHLCPVPSAGTNAGGIPPSGATVVGSPAWVNFLFGDTVYLSNMSNLFYDWITNHPNNTNNIPMNVGDVVTIHEHGPSYISADTIDDTFPAEPVEAFCLKYTGSWQEGGDDVTIPGVQGFMSMLCLNNLTHSNSVAGPVSQTNQCINVPPDYEPDPCGEVGSINPETGGMIFAVEQGPNQDVYYEVAPSNVLMVEDSNGNLVSVGPGTTPSAALGTLDCGDGTYEDYVVDTSICYSGPDTPYPLNNATLYFGFGPGSPNPTFNPSVLSNFSIVTVNGTNANGGNVFTPWAQSSTISAINIHSMPGLPYDTVEIVLNNAMTNGVTNTCTSSGTPAHFVVATQTTFTVQTSAGAQGWSLLGLEWGVYNRNVVPTTSAHFSGVASPNAVGYKNSIIIDNYTQFPSPPFGHPTLSTRHIAAEEALKYDVQQITSFPFSNAGSIQQIPFAEGEGWFLPSLDEFLEMINAVGPDSGIWNNPLNNTLAHADFLWRWAFDDNGNPITTDNQVYWTSSENDASSNINSSGQSSYVGSDPEKVAVAVHCKPFSGNGFHPHPLFTSRCHPLIARPIRKFICRKEKTPEYNYRDSHNIWVEGDGQQGAGGGGQQSLTPFVSVYSPGGAASGGGSNTQSARLGIYGDDIFCSSSVIGKEYFSWGVAMTDVMGNEFNEEAFTNINQQGNPTGTNPNGFVISIWDNQKQFLGKWHYKFSKHSGIRQNALNWNGYTRDCANHPSPLPGFNCYDDPVNGQNMPYQVVEADFPALIGLEMWGVTHLEGPHPIFRYGGNREEAARRRWKQPASSGTLCNDQTIPFSDWHHPYMENTFNGFTASYAYIKLEAAEMITQVANPANLYNPINGPNTDIDSMEVVCLRNLFLDTYQGFSPPNEDLAPYVGSLLGCGDISNHNWNDQNSQGGGYGWQWADPTKKGNAAFGDVYGISYVDGRQHDPGFQPFPFMNQGIGPNLALHPKHWAFIWHAAYKPNSGAVNWYKDLHDGYNGCFGYRCKWELGDVGPAGGIIVGVPNMIGWESVPGGAASNESDWYYEMSPIDLDNGSDWPPTEYGMWNSWIPRANVPASADASVQTGYGWMNSLCPGTVDMGGNLNSEFVIEINPYTITGNGIGEKREFIGTSGATTDIFPCSQVGMGGSVTAPPYGPIPTNILGAEVAFHLCANYETQDIYGNIYDDWYLPNIQESWYIMNNAPVGTFPNNPDERDNLYWTSNQYDEKEHISGDGEIIGDIYGWEQLTRNTMYDAGSSGFIQGQPNPTFTREKYAYAYNVAEKVTKQGPVTIPTNPPPPAPILNWQTLSGNTKATYVISKDSNCKVRAIRRFKCPPPNAEPDPWGT